MWHKLKGSQSEAISECHFDLPTEFHVSTLGKDSIFPSLMVNTEDYPSWQ